MVLIFLLQAALPAEAYASGDASARAALLRAGPHAVLPLRAVRPRAPRRIDELLAEIKGACASGPGAAELPPLLDSRRTLELSDASFRDAFVALAGELPLLYDPAFGDEVLGRRISLLRQGVPLWEVLDAWAEAAGVDWGLFYGRILFSRPERLWPAGPPPARRSLPPQEERAAKIWREELGADDPERREAAQGRLAALGEAAEDLLAEGSLRKEPELSARCRALLARLRASRPCGIFGPAAFERQEAGGGLHRMLEEARVTVRCSYQPVDNFLLQLILGPAAAAFEFRAEPVAGRVFADFQDLPAGTALALTCHAWGLEAWMDGDRLVVDTREAAARRLALLK